MMMSRFFSNPSTEKVGKRSFDFCGLRALASHHQEASARLGPPVTPLPLLTFDWSIFLMVKPVLKKGNRGQAKSGSDSF